MNKNNLDRVGVAMMLLFSVFLLGIFGAELMQGLSDYILPIALSIVFLLIIIVIKIGWKR